MEVFLIQNYYDKNGNKIEAGMKIRIDGGAVQTVCATTDAYGEDSLGIPATNPNFLRLHPDWEIEYYPLSSFALSDLEVVED